MLDTLVVVGVTQIIPVPNDPVHQPIGRWPDGEAVGEREVT